MFQEKKNHVGNPWEVSIDRPFDSVFYKDWTAFRITKISADKVGRGGLLKNPRLEITDGNTREATVLSFRGDFTKEQLLEKIRQSGYLISPIRQ